MSGVLERMAPPRPAEPEETGAEAAEAPEAGRGRGAARKPPAVRKKPKGRTVYLPDDLFERIIVQAHRRDRTISEYVTAVLERQVPDHRVIRDDDAAA